MLLQKVQTDAAFSKEEQIEGPRNSAGDSVCVLSTGGNAAESSSSFPNTGWTPLGGWSRRRSLPAWKKLLKCRRRWEVSGVIGKRTESYSRLQTPNGTAGRKFGGLGEKDSRDGKGCKSVISGTTRKVAAPLSDQQLQNRFRVMMSDEGLGIVFSAALEATEPESDGGTRRESEVSAE